MPADVGALIQACLNIDPAKRPSTAQILSHPFFADVSDEPFDVKEQYDAKIKVLINKS